MNRILLLILIFLAQVGHAEEPQEPQPGKTFEALDLFDLQWVADPQISPNGKQIVYVRRGFDVMEDRPRSSLWIIDINGNHHQPLTTPGSNDSSPRWSPDGKRLAYASNRDGSAQIHMRWIDTGRDTAITQLQHPPRSLSWSPDGSRLAFLQFVPKKVEPIGTMPVKPKDAKWSPDALVFEDSYYRSDAAGFLKPGKSQIFVVSSEGGQAVQLTAVDYPHSGNLSWSADGQLLYFSANYSDDWQIDQQESEIHAINVKDRTTTQITDRDGGDFDPHVSPDGTWLVYRGSDDVKKYQDNKLYLTRTGDHEPGQLLDLDRPVTGVQWGADSKSVYFSFLDQSVSKVARSDLKGKLKTVASHLGGTSVGRPYASASFSVSSNNIVAHDTTTFDQPANLSVTARGKTRTITNLNRDLLAYKEMGPVEEIWYESSAGGVPIQGWIIKPPGFDASKKYPLILEIHGGPQSAYGMYFTAELQLYAAAGYVVLYTNPRGSISYGVEFTRKIHHNYPGEDYDDLMSGVDAMIERGYVDPTNLFVTGGSGGGILTAWIVTKTGRFKAAVSQKPVINWYTHILTADIGPGFWYNFFDAPPWVDPAAYLAKSPISNVHKVTTPTMLLTGEDDWRTPMSESEQFYQGLKMNGVDSALVRIQESTHSIAARPGNLLRKVSYVLGWFDRYRQAD